MEQVVYIDIYFLINFSMDVLGFFLTSKLLSEPLNAKRAALAGAIGGVYACFELFLSVSGVWSLLLGMLAGVLICAVAEYHRGELRRLFEYSLVYTAVSIVLGGGITALFSLFNRLGLDKLLGSETDSDGVSVWLFALLAIISAGAALFGGRFFKKKSSRRKGKIEISIGDKTLELKALCDSGNLLCEPISGKPCVIIDKAEAAQLLPKGIASMIKSGSAEHLSAEEKRMVRVISATTVGGAALLYAVRAERIRIDMGNGWSEADAYAAFGDIGENADGAAALIPSALAFGAS